MRNSLFFLAHRNYLYSLDPFIPFFDFSILLSGGMNRIPEDYIKEAFATTGNLHSLILQRSRKHLPACSFDTSPDLAIFVCLQPSLFNLLPQHLHQTPTTSTTITMDQVKKQTSSQGNQNPKSMVNVEAYQRRWEQLMEDTNQQIQKIRGTLVTSDLSHAGMTSRN